MDRRQKKSREAIFRAFSELLSQKHFHQITVGEIIARADVGRATFYAHFETKDFLLKELCRELFCHVFDSVEGVEGHSHIFSCDAPPSVILHLLEHLQKNDNHILDLLACESNELFLRYFKDELVRLIQKQPYLSEKGRAAKLPESYWLHHVASVFVETVRWWLENGRKESPEVLTEYFFAAI